MFCTLYITQTNGNNDMITNLWHYNDFDLINLQLNITGAR